MQSRADRLVAGGCDRPRVCTFPAQWGSRPVAPEAHPDPEVGPVVQAIQIVAAQSPGARDRRDRRDRGVARAALTLHH
jgi:hypothetical protein